MKIEGKSPKVSIIMPTFNRANLITESVCSILNQTFPDWELIIIDDGSEDHTEKIISRIHDPRISFYKAGRIGKGGKIKNTGLEKISGEMIAFNDSDDLWAPTKLEKQVAALQEYPDAGFCLTGGYNFRNPGEPVNHFYKQTCGLKFDTIFHNCFRSEVAAFSQTLLFRKQCIRVAGLFNEEKSFSDADFIFNLAFHFKAVILYEPLVFRRLHNNNFITPNWEKSNYDGIELINSFRDKLPKEIYRNALFRTYTNFGEKYLSFRQQKNAILMFLKAWHYKPFSIVPLRKTIKSFLYFITGK